jgi:hypothetical protein
MHDEDVSQLREKSVAGRMLLVLKRRIPRRNHGRVVEVNVSVLRIVLLAEEICQLMLRQCGFGVEVVGAAAGAATGWA